MSTAGDIFSVVKNILLVKENLDRLSDVVDALADDIRDHERRLIRIETTLI